MTKTVEQLVLINDKLDIMVKLISSPIQTVQTVQEVGGKELYGDITKPIPEPVPNTLGELPEQLTKKVSDAMVLEPGVLTETVETVPAKSVPVEVEPEAVEKPEPLNAFTISMVRECLKSYISTHGMDKAREKIKAIGAADVSSIPVEKYGEFMDSLKS